MHASSSRQCSIRLAGAAFLALATTLSAQVPSGGPYSLPKQAIAGGTSKTIGVAHAETTVDHMAGALGDSSAPFALLSAQLDSAHALNIY